MTSSSICMSKRGQAKSELCDFCLAVSAFRQPLKLTGRMTRWGCLVISHNSMHRANTHLGHSTNFALWANIHWGALSSHPYSCTLSTSTPAAVLWSSAGTGETAAPGLNSKREPSLDATPQELLVPGLQNLAEPLVQDRKTISKDTYEAKHLHTWHFQWPWQELWSAIAYCERRGQSFPNIFK